MATGDPPDRQRPSMSINLLGDRLNRSAEIQQEAIELDDNQGFMYPVPAGGPRIIPPSIAEPALLAAPELEELFSSPLLGGQDPFVTPTEAIPNDTEKLFSLITDKEIDEWFGGIDPRDHKDELKDVIKEIEHDDSDLKAYANVAKEVTTSLCEKIKHLNRVSRLQTEIIRIQNKQIERLKVSKLDPGQAKMDDILDELYNGD